MSNKLRLEVTPMIKGFDGNFKTDEYLTFSYATHTSLRLTEGRDLVARSMFTEQDEALRTAAAIIAANDIDINKVAIRDSMEEMEIRRRLEALVGEVNKEADFNDAVEQELSRTFTANYLNGKIPSFNPTLTPSM